jgi:hypothetical protein
MLAMALLWLLGFQNGMNPFEFVLRSLVLGHGFFWVIFTFRARQPFFLFLGAGVMVLGWLAVDWLIDSWQII